MKSDLASWFKRNWPVIPPLAVLVAVASVGAMISPLWHRNVTLMLVYVIIVVSLYVFVGNSGVLSFGHASFLAISAYGSAILTMAPARKAIVLPSLYSFLASVHMHWLLGMLVAALLAAAFAFIAGYGLVRLKGIEAAVATFAVTVIVYTVANEWKSITTGNTSINVPRTTDFGKALILALIVVGVAWVFQQSRFGLRLRATREDEEVARSVGVHVRRERLIAFTLSGFLSGIGGTLYGHYLGSFYPGAFWLPITFLPIAMLVAGGMKSLGGAIFGAISVWAITEVLSLIESGIEVGNLTIYGPSGLRELGLGLFLLLILLLRPRGITGGREITWPFTQKALRKPSVNSGEKQDLNRTGQK